MQLSCLHMGILLFWSLVPEPGNNYSCNLMMEDDYLTFSSYKASDRLPLTCACAYALRKNIAELVPKASA